MNEILFSILVPAFKSTYLAECIDSILSQTYKNFELIIVNDASPEDLDDIVYKFDDKRIHYYKNENNIGAVNLVDNWNKCLSYAKGDYIICMGDDDKLLPNCLEEYNKLIEQYPGIGLLHGWTEIIDENSNLYQMTVMRGLHQSAYSLCWHRICEYYRQYVGDFCYERKWLVSHGGYYKIPLAWGSDDITALIGASKNGVANTQVPVFQYRSNRYSVTSTGNAEIKIKAINETAQWIIKYLNKECNNSLDSFYKTDSLKKIDYHYNKEKGVIIASDIYAKGFHSFLFWLLSKKKYNISYKTLFYAVLKRFRM